MGEHEAREYLRGKTRVVSFREFHEPAGAHARGLLLRSLLTWDQAGLIQSQFAGRSQDGRKLGGNKLEET